jgi:hypothetical protein
MKKLTTQLLPRTSGISFNLEDHKIINALKKKLGVDRTQIIRIALRVFAEKEGVTA